MPSSTLLPIEPITLSRSRLISGIEINQNQEPLNLTDSLIPTAFAFQTFHLSDQYLRASADGPPITGFQVCLNVSDIDTSVEYQFDYKLDDTQWVTIFTGTEVGSHAVGERIWFDIYFDKALPVTTPFLSRQFRFGIKTSAPWWYSLPNPLVGEGIYNAGGTQLGGGGSAMFRLLTASADTGTDFLGNGFRSVVKHNPAENVSTTTSNPNSQWLSKPNPSKFAVESLYFDLSDDHKNPTVVDRILLDPITPGVVFHVYYSSSGVPGTDDSSWNDRLWTPVLQTFKAERRQEHALPEPVVAKYIKIEFSHLQAQSYSAGTFQTPMRYDKHPKWVLEHFLGVTGDVTADPFVASQVNIGYDFLKLAYDYYLDDLRQEPNDTPDMVKIQQFLSDKTDVSDQLSSDTARRIKTNMDIYQSSIADVSRSQDSILATATASDISRSPTEIRRPAAANTTQVSSIDRSDLVQELQFPPMFFYIASRHIYRTVEATFKEDRAYFVGIRQIAFNRDHYSVAHDSPLYIESTGDMTNTWRSDFVGTDGTWRVY